MTRLRTTAVHGGRDDLADLGVHALPIDLSTTYPIPDQADGGQALQHLAEGAAHAASPVYSRLHNPTVARFEQALAALEGTSAAVAFGSGMAAVTAVVQAACVLTGKPHVVAVRPIYGGTDHLLSSGLLGVRTTYATADRVADAITPDTGLVVIETPANPNLDLLDIAAVVAQAGDVPVMVDNTFATPVLQNPAALGATYVLHSGTKYLGGHGDVLGGVVACGEEHAGPLRQIRIITGAVLHPLGGYLMHRGLATLPLRVEAAQRSAIDLAARLDAHPGTGLVRHPSLPGADPAGLIGTQLRGPGAVLAFTTREDPTAVVRRLKLITPAVSLGAVDTVYQTPRCGTQPTFKVKVGSHDRNLTAETSTCTGGTRPTQVSRHGHRRYASKRRGVFSWRSSGEQILGRACLAARVRTEANGLMDVGGSIACSTWSSSATAPVRCTVA